MELRCLSWRTVWFWSAHILIVIIDFGSDFFCCKVVLVLEGEVWQLITQHSRILSLSINVGKKKRRRSRTQFLSTLITQLLDKMLRLCEKVIVMKRIYTCIYIYNVCVCDKTTCLLVSIANYCFQKLLLTMEKFIGVVYSWYPLRQQTLSQVKAVEIK